MKDIILFIVFIFLFGPIMSQHGYKMYIDKENMWIGDQQYLHIQVDSTEKDKLNFSSLDTCKWFTVIKDSNWTNTKTAIQEKLILFTVFDTGFFKFPSLLSSHSLPTEIKLKVDFVPDEEKVLLPIKDIILTQGPSIFLNLAIIFGLFLLALTYIVWFFVRADRIKTKPFIISQEIPVWRKTIEKFENIDKQKFWQQGKIKEYYILLNETIRMFISEGLNVSAIENTSHEIIHLLQANKNRIDNLQLLEENFKLTDKVKFANYKAGIDLHQQQLEQLLFFVKSNSLLSEQIQGNIKLRVKDFFSKEISNQFYNQEEIIPNILLQLDSNKNLSNFKLISKATKKLEYQLPNSWIKLHQNKIGLLARWHNNLISDTNNTTLNTFIIILILPFISLIFPILLIVNLFSKTSIFDRGLFYLSANNKICINFDKL